MEAVNYPYEADNLASSFVSSLPSIPISNINEKLLEKIKGAEKALKPFEVVSIMFLLHNNASKTYVDLQQFLIEGNSSLIYKWCLNAIRNNEDQWENKFYESLFFIKNYKLLKQFDIEKVNAVHQYNHGYLIPNIRLTLYKICENVIGKKLELLLKKMDETDLRYRNYLELYILKWISEGRLSIEEDSIDVSSLIYCLKAVDMEKLADLLHFQKSFNSFKKLTNPFEPSDSYTIIDPNNVGYCIIINQKKFIPDTSNPSLVLNERSGTEKDCDSLKRMLEILKFDFDIIEDVSSVAIINIITDKVKKYFKPNHSIFLLIILSHGHKGLIFGSDSKPVHIVAIDKCLLMPELKKKPKVIIIQACQGENFLRASKLESDAPVMEWTKDTIFCMASIPYFASYRHLEKGTWYIQTLCKMIEQYPELEITKILNKVQSKLSNDPVFGTEQNIRSMPEFRSRLQKELYFKRKL